jgi:hypothetical protein
LDALMAAGTVTRAKEALDERIAFDNFIFGNLDRAAAACFPANARLHAGKGQGGGGGVAFTCSRQASKTRALGEMQSAANDRAAFDLFGASAILPRAMRTRIRLELDQSDAAAAAAFATGAAVGGAAVAAGAG